MNNEGRNVAALLYGLFGQAVGVLMYKQLCSGRGYPSTAVAASKPSARVSSTPVSTSKLPTATVTSSIE